MSKSTPKQKTKAAKTNVKKMVKKTASSSVSTTKAVLKAKRPAIPKPTARKVTTPKKTIKSIRKPAKSAFTSKKSKASTPKITAKPTTKTARPVNALKTTPSTLKDIYQIVTELETRMKRANTLTRKNVKTLETAVARARSSDKAALARKVNQLSTKFTDMVTVTQNSVNSELKAALANPSAENLKSALSRADQRLSQAESVQAEAVAKINRHLASIATAVDARISQEEKNRKTAIEALKTATSEKIETVEKETAGAFANIGDKITELADEIKRRGETSELSIREKISEIALQTQTEFEQYRAGLDHKIGNISQSDTGEIRRIEHTLHSLTSRLEELEHSAAQAQIPTAPPPLAPAVAAPQNQAGPPKLSVVETLPAISTSPLLSNPPASPPMTDAFTPVAQAMASPPPNPYANAQTAQTQQATSAEAIPPQDSHIPQEFDPRAFVRTAQPSPQPVEIPEQQHASKQTSIPPVMDPPPVSNLQPISVPTAQTLPLETMQDTYADPAYAENESTLASSRIGGDHGQEFHPPKFSVRNLRVAALATGVAVIGLVAAKGLLGNNDSTTLPKIVQNDVATNVGETPSQMPSPTVIEPIGNYADNKPTQVTGEAAKTLNSAAAAGDGVAQFQLGLSYLEQGRTDEGVDLIRKAANQNQPAAQYRLAKLYEVGEGVAQDAEMARQLTERAARNGNRIAMHDLALYYAEGRGGVSAELKTAAKWFEKAAERGVVDSQFNLGVLFESGQGLPQSQTDAFVWYSIAAKQGDQFAKKRVDILSDAMDAGDLSAAQARIEKFTPVKIDERANGIFRNVAWIQPDNDKAQQATQTRQVQSLLTELGYDIGGADGSIGPRTRAAIISFEEANGLPETGRVNSALIDRLELAAGA